MAKRVKFSVGKKFAPKSTSFNFGANRRFLMFGGTLTNFAAIPRLAFG